MIRIYKDRDSKFVTKGAYEQIYKPLGYNIILDEVKEDIKDKIETAETLKVDADKTVQTVTNHKKGSSRKKNKQEN